MRNDEKLQLRVVSREYAEKIITEELASFAEVTKRATDFAKNQNSISLCDKFCETAKSPEQNQICECLKKAFRERARKDIISDFTEGVLYKYAKRIHQLHILRYLKEGWTWGVEFDEEKKVTPELVPFECLIRNEKLKQNALDRIENAYWVIHESLFNVELGDSGFLGKIVEISEKENLARKASMCTAEVNDTETD